MRELTETDLEAVVGDYERNGYAYVRGLFTSDDLAPLSESLDAGGASPGGFSVTDSTGGQQELSVWTHLGDDLVGVIPRLAPVVDIAAAVVGEAVYHWHSKLSWKRPDTTSRWDWHQDYGFWEQEGVARSDMCTIAIAIGPVNEANGCMRLVRGSHHLGRLDIVEVGHTAASDPDAVASALDAHEIDLCELESGDAVVFHSNTLHASGSNQSELPRTMLMSSYNATTNPPLAPIVPGHGLSELDVLPASTLRGGWSVVFGDSVFIDPLASGYDQGYDITTNP